MSNKLGPTGKFPEGKLNASDEGELRFAIGHDHEKGVVVIQFGKPVSWLALPPELARALAKSLHENADRAENPQTQQPDKGFKRYDH